MTFSDCSFAQRTAKTTGIASAPSPIDLTTAVNFMQRSAEAKTRQMLHFQEATSFESRATGRESHPDAGCLF
jgi:hypothetical protein